MPYARAFGLQEKKLKQKKFLFLTMEAALPHLKLNGKMTMILMFSTPGISEKEKKYLKEAVRVGLFNSI